MDSTDSSHRFLRSHRVLLISLTLLILAMGPVLNLDRLDTMDSGRWFRELFSWGLLAGNGALIWLRPKRFIPLLATYLPWLAGFLFVVLAFLLATTSHSKAAIGVQMVWSSLTCFVAYRVRKHVSELEA